MSSRVVHFEIPVVDRERAIKFYTAVFGWEFPKWMDEPNEYWGVMTAEKDSTQAGINGGLMVLTEGKTPATGAPNAYVCTVQVDDFDATAEKITAVGGSVAMAKHAIPGMAWQGYFKDTEGNTFGVHQADKEAK